MAHGSIVPGAIADRLRAHGTPPAPADRLLVATALEHDLTLVTADRAMSASDHPETPRQVETLSGRAAPRHQVLVAQGGQPA